MINTTQRIINAIELAKNAHKNQKRKYTDDPYVIHPLRVALLVSSVMQFEDDLVDYEDAVCAALLHDTLEDTDLQPEVIKTTFGEAVLHYVLEVTDVARPEDGNRKVRKAIERAHLSNASSIGQTIKLADIIDNTSTIRDYDPSFAKVYFEEIKELLPILSTRGNRALYETAKEIIYREE